MKKRWIVVLIVINLLLAFLIALCLVGTCLNNRSINEASQFEYRTVNSEDKVRLNVDGENTVVLHFGADSVRITDSYKVTDRGAMLSVVCFVEDYVWETRGIQTRPKTELYGEFRLHNLLYRFGIEREHTAELDLDYIADERWYVNATSKIIGWCGL